MECTRRKCGEAVTSHEYYIYVHKFSEKTTTLHWYLSRKNTSLSFIALKNSKLLYFRRLFFFSTARKWHLKHDQNSIQVHVLLHSANLLLLIQLLEVSFYKYYRHHKQIKDSGKERNVPTFLFWIPWNLSIKESDMSERKHATEIRTEQMSMTWRNNAFDFERKRSANTFILISNHSEPSFCTYHNLYNLIVTV
jgi:hypothetical protein